MTTVSRDLPERPHLDVPKREARELLAAWRAAQPEALDRIRRRHPKYHDASAAALKSAPFLLADAQLVIAGEYGFRNWMTLKLKIEAHSVLGALRVAIHADRREDVVRILTEHPQLLPVPVWSGNWGPPMSHAANLGRLGIVQAVAQLGAQDFQQAFDRALLQGEIETARWLHAQGAKLVPGIVMGACETLEPAGLRFLLELGAPLCDRRGNRLAPLAAALGTYCRAPERKHAVLNLLAPHYELPDTPMMAFHRGQLGRLETFLQNDPSLVARHYSRREIYPPEVGCCDDDVTGGMCGTPTAGTTLLHLAIDFEEREIFDLLLTHGADVNARAAIDGAGFGGHTPLFHTVVNCGRPGEPQAEMARVLLARGASPQLRTTLRKFLDWRAEPGWHEAFDVTPVQWAEAFPEKNWVNERALDLLRQATS